MNSSLARSQMVMRAVVERNTASTKDEYNQPVPPTWTAQEDPLPCCVWVTEIKDATSVAKTAGLERWRGMFPKDADLLETDRIASVTDRQGVVIFTGPLYLVMPIEVRRTHLEVALRRVA